MNDHFDIAMYLTRLGIAEKMLAPTIENLVRLQKAHILHVPYETLDIFYARPTSLAIDALFDKVVNRQRGGYCFELNGLFAELLRRLGYVVEEYFGRWLLGEDLPVPARRHRIIKVTLDSQAFLADVGVGMRAPLEPLAFVYDTVQTREGIDYRLVRDKILNTVVQVRTKDVWQNFYSFDEAPQLPIDFSYVHYYCIHAPDSFFRTNLLLHCATPYGRNSCTLVTDPETGERVWEFASSGSDGQTVRKLARSESARAEGLLRFFGIHFEF